MPLPEDIARFIGQTTSLVYEVEKGAIARFAGAVGETNPLYYDEEYARKSRYGAIIAPPGFFGWPEGQTGDSSANLVTLISALSKAGYRRILDGGIDYEFSRPVRAGERLTVTTTIKNIMERTGKAGKIVFMVRETTYTNQNGELAVKTRQTTIHSEG